ncbi:hypothetical protein Tco_1037363 [Tanacetum coccineum]
MDEEVAQKLQEEFNAAERQRMAQVHQAAQGFTDAEWDDVLARVALDEDFVQQLQVGKKCSEEDLPMKLVELVNQRKKFFAQQRAEAKRNKPMTPAQQKVKDIFETTMRRVQSFVPMGSELEVQRLKRAGQEVLEKPVKRQKIGEASGSGEEQSAEKEKELSEEELQKLLVIVPVEELVIQPLQVRYPIIDWEVYSEDTRRYWRIIRVGNHTEAYQIFADMLKKFDRDDLVKLWDLVKERFSTTEPTDDKEKELWVELKRLFEPDNDDILWKLQRYMHDPLVWRLYDTCGVHHVSSVRGHDIFMLVEKEYPLTRGTLGLMMVARLLVEADSEMSRELLRKIFYQANRPRQIRGELHDKEKELWVELKRLFEPDNDDIIWKLQRYMHDPLVWRLYDTCGVHHVSSVRGHDIFMLVEKEYPLTRGTLGLVMMTRLLVEANSEMSRELLRKIFYQANRPRQGGLLGIRGFYNLMLLVQVCTAAED